MITLEEVITAYKDCRKRKRRTANAIDFERNLFVNCFNLLQEINQHKYYPSTSITFIVTKPKPREIFAANFRDRIVHHIIMNSIGHLFEEEFISNTFNCRKGKGVNYGVKQLHHDIQECSENYTQNCYVARFDLKGFFMTINKTILNDKLREFIQERYNGDNKETILELVNIVVSHCPEKDCYRKSPKQMWNLIPEDKSLFNVGDNFGLPIGNLTSQIFANFYLNDLDHLLYERFNYYGRYVDDFYIITKDKESLLQYIPVIRQFLIETVGVILHPDKFYIQHYSKGCDFTGATVKGKLIYTGNRTLRHCIEMIQHYNHIPSSRLSDIFISRMNSYFGFTRDRAAFNVRTNLTNRIRNRWWKYVNINNEQVFHSKNSFIQDIKIRLGNSSYFKILYNYD